MTAIIKRARKTVIDIESYKSARSLYKSQKDAIFLDANEAAFTPYIGADKYKCYPNQQPDALLDALSRIYNTPQSNIVATRGADDAIDIIIRTFCDNGVDDIIICPPTFPMYKFSAGLQGAACHEVPLTNEFQLDIQSIKNKATKNTKCVFVCSPNNPTGNIMRREDILTLCEHFKDRALVIIDETYIEYLEQETGEQISMATELCNHDNLIILRTLSKAYGAAGLRLGSILGQAELITLFRKVLPPYPLAQPVTENAVKTLDATNVERIKTKRQAALHERDRLIKELETSELVTDIFPSAANFVLCRVTNSADFLEQFRSNTIILRDQSMQPGLDNCVRISVGTESDMSAFYTVLKTGKRKDTTNQRKACITRSTNETEIAVNVNLDETAPVLINTGIGFYDHMLEQIAKHANISLTIECHGDLHIDPHHTIEDIAIALGQALSEAIGDKAGIERYGFSLPMDEAEAHVLLDLGGRFYLKFEADFPESMVGDLPTDMIEHIFHSLAENLKANLHIKAEGENTHHIVEGIFKAFARALKQAVHKTGSTLPSTKGVL